ncbi:dipeptide epimerase [Sphingomonas sp. URHD0057]|uniref:dipeptide epimerase n=1 Tax=Sphingomonas sp. URHD0057 TaxID=1380389 RepID=UPI001E5F1057|nr:dipeptide epimerase [Sphingomonas sp. URHD0057]
MTEPFRISGYVFEAMPAVIAAISDGRHIGRGEAAGVYYLGDDQDRMVSTIEEMQPYIEGGLSRLELQQALPPCGARNALDCALWELESKLARMPVWTLAGVPEPRPLTSTFTLPADDPQTLAEKIPRLSFAKAIKLKLEGDIAIDRERIAVVRKARPDAWLAVDANQGFAASDLDDLAQIASEFSVALIEQPVRRGEESALEGWRPGVPVAADESIVDLNEFYERAAYFDVVNIKLDKCGGLTEGLKMADAARSAGKQIMVGNMGGSTLAMAPAFVLGQLCQVVDLDGPIALADDPLASEIYRDGEIFVSEAIWGG